MTNPMKDSDEQLAEALENLYYAGVEADSIEAVSASNNRAVALQRAKAAIQAHYQPQAVGDEPSVMELMVQIRKYWVTATGEPELKEFAEYVQGIIKERQHPSNDTA